MKKSEIYQDITEEEIIRELFGTDFADYLEKTRRGNSDPRVPLKLFYTIKSYAQSKIESTRLVTIKNLEKKSGISSQNIRNHIMNFIRTGIITDHAQSQKLLANKKAVTYTIQPYDDWNKDIEVDIDNHIRLMIEPRIKDKYKGGNNDFS